MIPASDRYVSKSHNGCPGDERPKRTKAPAPIERELLLFAKRAAGLISKALQVSERRVVRTRSGDDALSVRRVLFYYLRGKDYPIGMLAQIFGVDRGLLTSDLQFIQRLVADDEEFDALMDDLIEGTDHYMRVNPGSFIDTCLAELEADRSAAQAIQTIRQATKAHERAMEKKAGPPEAVLRACEGLPDHLKKKVLDRWVA